MSRNTKSRDVTLNALAVLTGGLTAAAFVGTGLATGLAADYTAQKAQAKAQSKAAAAPLRAVAAPAAKPLPVRTVVTTRFVQGQGSCCPRTGVGEPVRGPVPRAPSARSRPVARPAGRACPGCRSCPGARSGPGCCSCSLGSIMMRTLEARATGGVGIATWRALGTYVHLSTAQETALEPARHIAIQLLADVDRTCSRFRKDSDLVRANAGAGSWTRVDPMLVHAIRRGHGRGSPDRWPGGPHARPLPGSCRL